MRPHPTGSGKAGRDPTGSRLQPVPGNSSLSKDGKDLKKNQKERCVWGWGGGGEGVPAGQVSTEADLRGLHLQTQNCAGGNCPPLEE